MSERRSSFAGHFVTDRTVFHSYFQPDAWTASSFARVRTIRNAIHGRVELHKMERQGQESVPCVVKVMENRKVHCNVGKETDERKVHFSQRCLKAPNIEDALTEIGVFSYIASKAESHPNLLKMIGVFVDPCCTRLVTEECEGGELLDVILGSGPLKEETAARYLRQMFSALQYLLKLRIGHRDVSLENALLRRGEVQLMDFGQAVETHSPEGQALRYFSLAGKDMYRAPEVYVPARGPVVRVEAPQVAPEGESRALDGAVFLEVQKTYLCEVSLPERARPGSVCDGQLLGYIVPPVDVFAVGVCMFIMCLGYPPWKSALLSDAYFRQAYCQGNSGISGLARQYTPGAWLMRSDGMQFLSKLLRPNPALRPTVAECLVDPWIAGLVESCSLLGNDAEVCSISTEYSPSAAVSEATSDSESDRSACTTADGIDVGGGSNQSAEEVDDLDDVQACDVTINVRLLENIVASEDGAHTELQFSLEVIDVTSNACFVTNAFGVCA